MPMPSPFDEKSEKKAIESPFIEEIVDEISEKVESESAYLVPIVEVKGDEPDSPDVSTVRVPLTAAITIQNLLVESTSAVGLLFKSGYN